MQQITLDPLDKFDENYKSTTAWVRKFQEYAEHYNWDESTSVRIFKLHLRSDASDWFYQLKEKEETNNFNLYDWLKALQQSFPDKSKVGKYSCTIGSLTQLRRHSDESMENFVVRFESYKAKVDPQFYTEPYIKEIFLQGIKETDSQIWWAIESRRDLNQLKQIMDETIYFSSRFTSPIIAQPSMEDKRKTKPEKLHEQSKQIDDLTKQIERLELLIKSDKPKSPVACYTCGQQGHRSNDIKFHPDHPYAKAYETRTSDTRRTPATGANSVPLGEKVNICREVPLDGMNENILATKRIRIEELLNEPAEIRKNKSNNQTKRKLITKPANSSPLVNSMLDCVKSYVVKFEINLAVL